MNFDCTIRGELVIFVFRNHLLHYFHFPCFHGVDTPSFVLSYSSSCYAMRKGRLLPPKQTCIEITLWIQYLGPTLGIRAFIHSISKSVVVAYRVVQSWAAIRREFQILKLPLAWCKMRFLKSTQGSGAWSNRLNRCCLRLSRASVKAVPVRHEPIADLKGANRRRLSRGNIPIPLRQQQHRVMSSWSFLSSQMVTQHLGLARRNNTSVTMTSSMSRK